MTAQTTRRAEIDSGTTRRTLRALLASALGVLPLCELFTDVRWVFEIWFAMLIAIAPAAILRRWRRPRVMHTWFGLALVVIWLTARYTPKHAFLGLLPTAATWHDVSKLMSSVHETTSSGVAPVHTTLAIKFALAAILALLAALVDLIAVMGRRGALAGVPLLVVFTVSGAVPRHPVSWVYFTGAAIGFLLLLSIDADDEVRGWGRLIPRAGEARKPAGLAVSGPRIAAIALAVAVVLPLIAPARPANLIADAFHNKHGGSGGIGGTFGAGGGISLDPFDALKGDLQRSKPVNLFTVSLGSQPSAPAFYLRANVLTNYSGERWSASRHGGTERIGETFYDTTPPTSTQQPTVKFTARIGITGLADNPPIFGLPVRVDGVEPSTNWSREDALLLGSRVHNGQQITEDVSQVTPTITDLEAAPADYPADILPARQVPAKMPKVVSDLVTRITAGKTTPYAKARALSDYFTSTANGFTYSLTTKSGNSGSDLVDFLTNKEGFCQQYAGAMAIMLRMAGVPARVVLGYTHANPDRSGTFNVTTNDAHAWVEAYFGGLGWIPFDPTPLVGINGGIKADLPWAPHPAPNTNGGQEVPTVTGSSRPSSSSTESVATSPGASTASNGGSGYLWPVVWALAGLLVVAALVLIPASIRWRRRRRRLRAAEHGDPDPLWAELSDTAIDLGYVWSPARTPRQVAGWLGRQVDAPAAQSLNTLASAVEVSRYARTDGRDGRTTLVAELRTVEARLRADRSRSVRVSARLLPASLGWRRLRLAIPRRKRH